LGRFLSFVAINTQGGSPSRISVLHATLSQFTRQFLSKTDIHDFAVAYDAEARKDLLTAYFVALTTLEAHGAHDVPLPPSSALLEAAKKGEASIYALFGGQGTNEVYFDELQSLFDIYKPYLVEFLSQATEEILKPFASKAEKDGFTFYSYGLDVIGWLNGSVARPPVEYFASIPISFPLIGLTQLAQYLVFCQVSRLTPGQLRNLVHGATGHSQGLVSAVAIAASTNFESFNTNSKKALRWLFYSGLRGQEAFPVLSIEPSITNDSIEGGEGTPSPMLAVTGLTLKALQPHIDQTNSHLPANSRLFVSLNNGPKAFVVTGPPRSLYGLVTALRKIKAPSGLDQSKIPYSKRKAVFSIRFLVVGVPYHSEYLKDATEKMCKVDLKGEELWESKELGVPVYHTENGVKFQKKSFDVFH
jgi:fatty acid synthase subunit alpha